MKNIILFFLVVSILFSCESDEIEQPNTRYYLYRVGSIPISGHVDFTDLGNGILEVNIVLENTIEAIDHPAHLHFGNVDEQGELAFALNDVTGLTGLSVTLLDNVSLSSGEVLTYELLHKMNGSVKIHRDGKWYVNETICTGNIGKNQNGIIGSVSICNGH